MPPLDGGITIAPADRLTVLDWIQRGDIERDDEPRGSPPRASHYIDSRS
jgi:hypothetical protein